MNLNLEFSEYEIKYLEREYKRRGLGIDLPGNNPSPVDMAIKKIVEAARKQK
jgi:hypothetical protein